MSADIYLINESPTGEASTRQAAQRLAVLLNGLMRLGAIVQHGDRHFHDYARWRSGSGAPDASLGYDGDYYLNTATSELYLRSGTWGVIATLGGTGGTGLSTVCLNLPAEFGVTPSCVVDGDDIFTVTWASESADTVLRRGHGGGAGVPSFGQLHGAALVVNSVPLSKLAQVGGFFVLANPTGSTGDVQAVGLGNAFAFDGVTGQVRTVAYTGDVTIAANATATVLATVNANVGAFGAASKTLVLTVNAKGLVTAAAETPIAITSSQVSGLAAIATSGSASDLVAGTVPAARMPAFTGDVTTVAGAVATTLASVGTAGTYSVVTTDAKGRVTAGSVATLTAGTGLAGGGTLDASRSVAFAAIADGMLLANLSGGSLAPSAHTLDAVVNALLSPSTGDLFVWNAGVLAKLSPGSANQAVVSNGAGSLPSYKTASVGGSPVFSGTYDCSGNISGTISGLTIVWT